MKGLLICEEDSFLKETYAKIQFLGKNYTKFYHHEKFKKIG
jgi:hypothetical protein